MHTFCTYADRNYATRVAAMARSLAEHCSMLRLFVLCLDDATHEALSGVPLPGTTLLRLGELERADAELQAVKERRTTIEYYYTCTACLAWHLLSTACQDGEVLTYVDADLFFFGSVEPLFDEFAGYSIGVTWQRFPEFQAPRVGKYNVGWNCWRRDSPGIDCVKTYRQQCLDWCHLREEDGKYADQVYLDQWSSRPGFYAFKNHGANVAPWNIADYRLTFDGAGIQVDGSPLVFFHFSRFSALGGDWFDTGLWNSRRVSCLLKERLVVPYVNALREVDTGLPLTGTLLRHFPYKSPLGRAMRNLVRVSLSCTRQTIVRVPRP